MSSPKLGGLESERCWTEPAKFHAADVDDIGRVGDLVASGAVKAVIDPVSEFGDELYELRRIGPPSDRAALEAFRSRFSTESDTFGVWVFFPWSGELVRYPDKHLHRDLRTFRNRDLITVAEQSALGDKRIAVFGLSVGSNVVDQFVQTGIGAAYLLGDADLVSPSNLNRIRASMRHVGMTKIDVLACKISEIDPYVEQVHLREGFSQSSLQVLEAFKADLIVEEVDDLAVKAQIRLWASRTRTPLIMVSDVGERSVVDVERHDLEEVRPFNGRLSRDSFDKLADGRLDQAEVQRVMIKIVGARHLSVRMVKSAALVGKELAGVPQLGSSATAGAAIATVAARSLFLGEALKSGAYTMSPRRILQLGRQAGVGEAFGAFWSLRQARSGS